MARILWDQISKAVFFIYLHNIRILSRLFYMNYSQNTSPELNDCKDKDTSIKAAFDIDSFTFCEKNHLTTIPLPR